MEVTFYKIVNLSTSSKPKTIGDDIVNIFANFERKNSNFSFRSCV
eukprot:UN11602